MNNLYIVLLHYPVYNRSGDVVATSVANMDIHDISRVARTYGVKRFYIVTPIESQRDLASKIIRHWKYGYGSQYNEARKEAFRKTEIRSTLGEVVREVADSCGSRPRIVVTGARLSGDLIGFRQLGAKIAAEKEPFILVFGTGWGITEETVKKADYRLEPVKGPSDYNHLSVRCAAAVTLDRLLGR
ncbi:MAG: RNA methyltransferase [Syntrophales bacterium]